MQNVVTLLIRCRALTRLWFESHFRRSFVMYTFWSVELHEVWAIDMTGSGHPTLNTVVFVASSSVHRLPKTDLKCKVHYTHRIEFVWLQHLVYCWIAVFSCSNSVSEHNQIFSVILIQFRNVQIGSLIDGLKAWIVMHKTNTEDKISIWLVLPNSFLLLTQNLCSLLSFKWLGY